MSKTIFTHPDNVALLKHRLGTGEFDGGMDLLPYFTIRPSSILERDKPTGRYVLPGGDVVERDAVCVEGRFFTYGPEDVDYLLWAGVIQEERELLFVIMDDYRISSFASPTLSLSRVIVTETE